MRPRYTWRVPQWGGFGWEEPLPGFRRKWGDEIANVIEVAQHMAQDRANRPTAQDIKHTLRAIAERPAEVDLVALDPDTDARLTQVSFRLHRVMFIECLKPQQLAECARIALAELKPAPGRPRSDALALALVSDLLALLPGKTPPARRDLLLKEALTVCHFGASERAIKKLHAEAVRAQKRASLPRASSSWCSMVQALDGEATGTPKRRRRRAG
jgi:hypothetical protein